MRLACTSPSQVSCGLFYFIQFSTFKPDTR
jgi:hypothetical protein